MTELTGSLKPGKGDDMSENDQAASKSTVENVVLPRLSLRCRVAHRIACGIMDRERAAAEPGEVLHDLGWLTRMKYRMGDFWITEWMEKRCRIGQNK